MKDLRGLMTVFGAAMAFVAWVTFAEHPTAKNLRQAILKTLPPLF